MFFQPLGANDPGVLAPFGVNTLTPPPLPPNWQEEVARSNQLPELPPLPSQEQIAQDWTTPQVPGIAQVTNAMAVGVLGDDPQGALALAGLTNSGAQAEINRLQTLGSINTTNDLIAERNFISDILGVLTGVNITSNRPVGVYEPPGESPPSF